MPAQLGDKAATGLQGALDAGDHRLGVAHPVQSRVREHCVEFGGEGQLLPVHQPRVEAARLGGGDQFGRGIDRDDFRAGRRDLLRQHAVTAAEVEDALAGPRIEQLDDRHAEHRHEGAGLGIALGLPALTGDRRHVQTFAVSAWRRNADKVVRVVIISGSIRNSMTAGRPAATASSKAGANSSVRATLAPNPP